MTISQSSLPQLSTPPPATPPDLVRIQLARDLYWQNVVREMLTGLSMMQESNPEIFDGRLAVLTRGGDRIPIAEVFPMFACGVNGSVEDKAASVAVECTVFRIRTPGGEVFTFPLHEIRALHTLSTELLKHLEQESLQRLTEDGTHNVPFGFAAFTSSGKNTQLPATTK
ncbi:MAG: hypothetical protein H7210_12430 [Pyrinomonadaceae bacterium]|nr:hypothetical protein [Phycisphaerales bacterium]